MGRYAEDAKELLRLVGGRENIVLVDACMTRLRVTVKNAFCSGGPGKSGCESD